MMMLVKEREVSVRRELVQAASLVLEVIKGKPGKKKEGKKQCVQLRRCGHGPVSV